MKKTILLIFIFLFLIPIEVFASPTSFTRTEANLLVPSDVIVDDQVSSRPADSVDGRGFVLIRIHDHAHAGYRR